MFPKKITKLQNFQITNINSFIYIYIYIYIYNLLYYINYILLENNHIIRLTLISLIYYFQFLLNEKVNCQILSYITKFATSEN